MESPSLLGKKGRSTTQKDIITPDLSKKLKEVMHIAARVLRMDTTIRVVSTITDMKPFVLTNVDTLLLRLQF
jgi:hypothetical protein